MQRVLLFLCLVFVARSSSAQTAPPRISEVSIYRRMCDASAAVAITADIFVVASDEGAALRLYRQDQETPLYTLELADFLELEDGDPEADIEGAAWLGDRIYWITSHGRNSDGEKRPNRRRIFATRVKVINSQVRLEPVGEPYRHLLRDLKNDVRFDRFNLDDASKKAAEEEGGLNIEGLSSTEDGALLVGFRNPRRSVRPHFPLAWQRLVATAKWATWMSTGKR